MSGQNSVFPFTGASLDEVILALGITQFSGTLGEKFTYILNGLIIQGGITSVIAGVSLSANIPFNVGFTKQVLLVLLTEAGTSSAAGGGAANVVDLNNFQVANKNAAGRAFYWLAIGV